jgi:hypothetical protein
MFASRQSSTPRFPRWLVSGSVIALYLTASSGPAWAYRPFDGTDAAVAAPGELEIELQPAGRIVKTSMAETQSAGANQETERSGVRLVSN